MPPGPANAGEDEASVIARLRAGDRKAFAALVQRNSGALLRVARSLVHDPATAEELVQETWLAVLTGLDAFQGRSALRTWLFRILVNKAHTRFARDGRVVSFSALPGSGDEVERDRFDAGDAWNDPPAPWSEDDPERLALGAETRAAIEACLAELPASQRAVMTLRDIEDVSPEEICNLLSISLTNQRVLLHRARAKVRLALERRLGGTR